MTKFVIQINSRMNTRDIDTKKAKAHSEERKVRPEKRGLWCFQEKSPLVDFLLVDFSFCTYCSLLNKVDSVVRWPVDMPTGWADVQPNCSLSSHLSFRFNKWPGSVPIRSLKIRKRNKGRSKLGLLYNDVDVLKSEPSAINAMDVGMDDRSLGLES